MAVPPPQSGPPPEGEVSIQTATLVCIWVLFGISSVAMTLRIWAQVQILRTIRLDDGLMCIAWVCMNPDPVVEKRRDLMLIFARSLKALVPSCVPSPSRMDLADMNISSPHNNSPML